MASRIAWLYEGENHAANPILVQALDTLAGAGANVRVFDLAQAPIRSQGYSHVPGGNFSLLPANVRTFGIRGALILVRMLFRAFQWRPQLVIASDPDVACIGWVVSRLLRIPLVYYPFELYGEERLRNHTRLTRFYERAERALLEHGVDGVITQNSFRAAVYRDERGSRVEPTVVHNHKPRWQGRRSEELKAMLGLDLSTRVVLYEGVLQAGRCLENLIRAAGFFPRGTILVLIGPQGQYAKEVLMPLAASVAPDTIRFLPGVQHEELLTLVSGADAGVVIYDDGSRNNLFCAPGKLSDYVNAGIPVVASSLPPLVAAMERYDIGACFDNDSPESIAAATAGVLRKSKADWQLALREAQQHLVWETQEDALRAAVLGLLPEFRAAPAENARH